MGGGCVGPGLADVIAGGDFCDFSAASLCFKRSKSERGLPGFDGVSDVLLRFSGLPILLPP